MELLSSWIGNILLFILLASVVELLLPQSAMQKYVKMVLGLLLIVIILTPVFKIFSLDPESLLAEMGKLSPHDQYRTENSLEKKKIEIQAQQRAYILEQTAVQMQKNAEKELMETFGYQFGSIELDMLEDPLSIPIEYEQLLTNMERVSVTIKKADDGGEVEPVQEVVIQTNRSRERLGNQQERIVLFLAQRWGIDGKIIELRMEGGDGGS